VAAIHAAFVHAEHFGHFRSSPFASPAAAFSLAWHADVASSFL